MEVWKFIKEIVAYGFIFFLCAVLLSTAIYRHQVDDIYFYETDRLVTKLMYYKNNKANIDTVFIGSSMTDRGIIPELFDTETGLQSFNLAEAGLRSYRAIQVVDELIEIENENLRYVFLEIQPQIKDEARNHQSNPSIFATRWSLVPEYLENVSIKNEQMKIKLFFDSVIRLAYKYVGFGSRKQIAIHLNKHDVNFSENIYRETEETNGYSNLDHLTENRNIFFNRTDREEIMLHRAEMYNNDLSRDITSDLFTKNIISRIEKLQQRGVRVYVIIPPRNNFLDYQLQQKQMYENNLVEVVDMADPDEYPDFYFNDDYSYDALHFSKLGAETYTKELSKKFLDTDVGVKVN